MTPSHSAYTNSTLSKRQPLRHAALDAASSGVCIRSVWQSKALGPASKRGATRHFVYFVWLIHYIS